MSRVTTFAAYTVSSFELVRDISLEVVSFLFCSALTVFLESTFLQISEQYKLLPCLKVFFKINYIRLVMNFEFKLLLGWCP